MCVCVCRDNEDAYVSVNEQTCWVKSGLDGNDGEQLCGGIFKEEVFPIRNCYITLSAGGKKAKKTLPLTVRVWTNLDGKSEDESFAIDNVAVKKVNELPVGTVRVNKFDSLNNMEGWDCSKITECGNLGRICGGYEVKGKEVSIKQTYTNLPPGTYSLELDFIKIDSW